MDDESYLQNVTAEQTINSSDEIGYRNLPLSFTGVAKPVEVDAKKDDSSS